MGVVKELFQQLAGLQHRMETDIANAMSNKEEQLAEEYNMIMTSMKQVVKDCNIIGKVDKEKYMCLLAKIVNIG